MTEGTWDIRVVNGDLKHPSSRMRISNQFRALMGYDPQELPDGWDTQVSVTHPDDLAGIMAIFEHEIIASQGSGQYVFEYRMRHKTRGYLWCRERGRAVRNERGQLPRVIGAVRDISDERSAQASHQQMLEQIFETPWLEGGSVVTLVDQSKNQRFYVHRGGVLENQFDV